MWETHVETRKRDGERGHPTPARARARRRRCRFRTRKTRRHSMPRLVFFFSFAKARSRERDYATRLKRMQRNNGSVVCLSALRLEKKRKRGCKAARARGRATRGGGKRERERVPRTFSHATGTNERTKSPRQRSFDDVCFFSKPRMISDAFFLVVVCCFKSDLLPTLETLLSRASCRNYLRKCLLETPQIKKNN